MRFTTDADIDADAVADTPAPAIYPMVADFKAKLAVLVRANQRDDEAIERLQRRRCRREQSARNLRRQIREWGGTLSAD